MMYSKDTCLFKFGVTCSYKMPMTKKSLLYANEQYANKDKDVFIDPKEFVSHMMMTQTKDRLYHQLKQIYKVYILPFNSKHN